jgi:hypothetical protein
VDTIGVVGDTFLSKKKESKKKRVVESSLSSAPDTHMEQIDTSSKKKPMPEINEEAGEQEEDNEARGSGSKKEEKGKSSSSSDSDEDQWVAKMDDVPKKKANPKAASKKVPEEGQSSSMDENSEADYEQATLSQQEVDNEVSKLLESDPEEAIEEEKPMRKNFKLAIKCMYSSSSFG